MSRPPKSEEDNAILSDRQKLFVVEYLKDQNATQAAIRAGYNVSGAQQQASRLMLNVVVRQQIDAALAAMRAKVEEEAGIKLADVVRKIGQLAFFDIRTITGPNGELMPPSEWPDDAAAAVGGLDILEEFEGSGQDRRMIGHTKKVKLLDRTKSLDMLMKHLGGYEKDNTQGAEALGREMRTLGDSERAVRLAQMLGSNPDALVAVIKQAAAKVAK